MTDWREIQGDFPINDHFIDFRRIRADAMCFSAWKWLLGPLGLGVMVLDESSAERLAFPFKGCDSVERAHQYLPYKTELKKGAARYMTSTAPYMEWVYFHESLRYLQAIGFDNVMSRIIELSDILSQGLVNLGFETAISSFQGKRTGIISARRPDASTLDLVKALEDEKTIAKERLGYLRLEPHIYQSEEQMEKTLAVLAKAVSSA